MGSACPLGRGAAGVTTRRVDDLGVAMGGTGISRSEVSRLCAQLDADAAVISAQEDSADHATDTSTSVNALQE